ncbi:MULTISPECIES: barstar family protein [Hwangdonia]|uniref:Barstar family protein n=1 Tax=Hwangdonia seohaensis TaxID=1240727 RepID=A0ABW3R9X6_9FLAO|nr:barstar family protein [Hwangdonia seohaensis]
MKTKSEYILNGSSIKSEKSFYNQVEKQLTFGLTWKIGRNLNAFNDVLRGGFGRFDCDEKIILKWKNFKKSEEYLSQAFLNRVLEIIDESENITFIKVN